MDRNLPIVYVLDIAFAVTGAFVVTCNEARVLKDAARIVRVLPAGSTIPPEELRDFWRVEYLPMVTLSKNLRAVLLYLPVLVYGAWRLRRMMRHDGATRLQLNDFYLMYGPVLRLLGFKGYIVSWVRCDPARFVGFLARPMLWLAHRAASRMVVVSAFVQSLMPKHVATDIVYDCYQGATRLPRVWQLADEKPFIFVGNYIEGKGQEVALAAFASIAVQDATIRLAFYGGDMGLAKNREYRRRLEDAAVRYGIASRVHFGDFVSDTYSVLEGAYAALNFSTSESFSMTVLEASGAGVPVIATACGGPQEIVRDGVTGYLIPVGDVAAAAARMLELARDPLRAAAMGQAGAALVQQLFSPQQFRSALHGALAL